MTTIDHRILIPAGPEAVWEYVSDITHNPDWQIDCAEVIFLTSRREGPGVRWRYSAPSGHEFVVAVTAWYNGLGYEYYFVDGVPFKENKGRIRLQEIPEGTIVQWTFTYELGGLLGGMRNTLGVSRQVNGTISESLKTLYQKIKQSGAASRPHEAKSLMRDAPNVDARSAYQPRHPSVMAEEENPPAAARPRFAAEPPISEGDGQRIRVIAEPPIAEDDTRKRKAVTPPLSEDAIPADIEGEPDFLKQIVDLSRFEPPRSPSDTQPRRPVTAEEIAPPSIETPPPPIEAIAPPKLAVPPAVEDTAPLTELPPAALEEPTAPAAETREETQPDYMSPVRIYERPAPPVEAGQPPIISEPPLASEPEPVLPLEEAQPAPPPPPPPVIEAKTEPVEPLPTPPFVPMVEVIAEPVEPKTVEAVPESIESVEAPSATPPAVEAAPEPAAPVEPLPARLEPKVASESASIWEIFGVPRPSETQEAAALGSEASARAESTPEAPASPSEAVVQPAAAAPTETALPARIALPSASSREGLRVALRRKIIFVRRP